MKLQRAKALQIGDKVYSRWTVNLPPAQVEQLKWGKGDVLDSQVEGKGEKAAIVIRRLAKAPPKG